MDFKPVQKLQVTRTLSTGNAVPVGVLAQNRQHVFFQYEAKYVSRFGNLSPFMLHNSNDLQTAPREPHDGLHGLFADSLPDGWGLLLQNRVFRQQGILPSQVTPMDRLAFIGSRGMGALTFAPESDLQPSSSDTVDMATLGLEAQALFDGQTTDVLAELVAAGSSGGARPKAQLFFPPGTPNECRTRAAPGDDAWLVKFTSQSLSLGHEEGLCEAVYLQLAKMAGLQPPEWQLLDAPKSSGARAWLAVKRFDWMKPSGNAAHQPGRLHMHSACGLLDADYRTPSLDYLDLIKASRQLCRSPAAGQLQFRRAIFNLLACNQDDHSKNWAFLQDDSGQWQPAPFYDATFSPHPFNEHATAFMGYGKKPPLKAMQKLADAAGFAGWKQAQQHIHETLDVLTNFSAIASDYGISKSTVAQIEQTLANRQKENSALL
jgi:serine/threonine-protein kinase HipA